MSERRRKNPADKGNEQPAAESAGAVFAFQQGTIGEAMHSRREDVAMFEYVGVHGGYRLHNHTAAQALRTLFQWHNETINVWVHIAGFLLCGALICHVSFRLDPVATAPVIGSIPHCVSAGGFRAKEWFGLAADCATRAMLDATTANEAQDRWPLVFFLASAMVCLGGSSVYHLFGTANSRWTSLLATADYAGVTALIVGSFVPLVHFGFRSPELRQLGRVYSGLMCALGAVVLVLSASSFFHDERLRALRVSLYVALGFAGGVPIGHVVLLRGFDPVSRLVLWAACSTGGMYLLGCVFYISRFPEVLAPGRFDRIGSSHNIWHALIVAATMVHYSSVLDIWHAAHV